MTTQVKDTIKCTFLISTLSILAVLCNFVMVPLLLALTKGREMTCSEACLVLDTLVLLAYKEKNTHIYDNYCINKSKVDNAEMNDR